MSNRGAIRNRDHARQLKDFSGLRYGKITPTDIDGFMDFGGRLFVVIEGKHAGAPLQYGQRLALERLVDACHLPPHRIAVCIIVDHYEDVGQDVDYANCAVRSIRWNGRWTQPMQRGINLRQAIDRMKAYSENMQRSRLRLINGGAS